MKVEFLKDHLSHSKGDVIELEDKAAEYLVRVSVAKSFNEETPKPKGKPKDKK